MADDNASDVNTQPVETQETTPTDPSPVETKVPEVADPLMDVLNEDEPKPEPKKETESEEGTEPAPEQPTEPEAEETETEEQPRGKKDANTRIRELANQNREYRQEIERLNAQVYRPQTVEELVQEGESEAMARVKALEQQVEVQNFTQHVAELNHGLNSESEQVLRDFPIFDPDSPDYKPEIADRVTGLYQQAAQLQKDPNTGLPISANVMPYEFFKTFAETYQSSAAEGQARGQKAAEQMLASAETPVSSSPKEGKKDLIMEALLSDDK